MEPCVRIQAWAARPIVDLGTYAYAYEASMRTHRSHSDPGSLLFDPEIERTLRRTRQARRRAELARLSLNSNPFYSSDSSSDSDTQSSSSVSSTSTMAERLTLKQLGGANIGKCTESFK
ncbi:hypothetical protein PIB30_066370 [Stylosanthes scabra]|uniref:Uncharacterized protein n=1 Tax=Stylosanthes scabra TaxID=79078 RepID=A0ABU6RN13_9FABA|nr:hypothetical protein [Stylosanthes scabra]